MRIYKAGNKFIAIQTKGNTVYSVEGKSEQQVKDRMLEIINKRKHDTQTDNQR